jgi:hypothetical protein
MTPDIAEALPLSTTAAIRVVWVALIPSDYFVAA